MKWFSLTSMILSIAAGPCLAQDLNIAEKLGEFSFTSTVLTLATVDDPNLTPIAARLTSDQPTTLFAPSNDAFAALGDDLLVFLSQNLDVLAEVLLYHVVDAVIPASAITVNPQNVATLQGQTVNARLEQQGFGCRFGLPRFCTEFIFINDSSVNVPDLFTSNGVVHVIDEVLTFPGLLPTADLLDTAAGAGLDLLVAAVDVADLTDTLRGDGPFTVFAPTDDAFLALGETLDFVLTPEGQGTLVDILLYHVVVGQIIKAKDISFGLTVQTALGETVTFFTDNAGIRIQDSTPVLANVILADVLAFNGVAHVIDKVIIPASL